LHLNAQAVGIDRTMADLQDDVLIDVNAGIGLKKAKSFS
jgi:hypothetical protein